MTEKQTFEYSYPYLESYLLGQIDFQTAIDKTIENLNSIAEKIIEENPDLIDKINNIGCTSFLMTPEEVAELVSRVSEIENRQAKRRGQRAKCELFEDGIVDTSIVEEVLSSFYEKAEEYETL